MRLCPQEGVGEVGRRGGEKAESHGCQREKKQQLTTG